MEEEKTDNYPSLNVKSFEEFQKSAKHMDTKDFCKLYGVPEEGIYVSSVISYGPYFIEKLQNGEYMANFMNFSYKSNLLVEVEEYFWNNFVKGEMGIE